MTAALIFCMRYYARPQGAARPVSVPAREVTHAATTRHPRSARAPRPAQPTPDPGGPPAGPGPRSRMRARSRTQRELLGLALALLVGLLLMPFLIWVA